MEAIQDERYKCPLCMQSFSDDEVVKNLTEEDVPQASLGGKRIALTCRSCNSTCGHSIDINLLNVIVCFEQKKFWHFKMLVWLMVFIYVAIIGLEDSLSFIHCQK